MVAMVATFLYSLSLFFSAVFAFTFTAGTLSQCEDLTLEWTGGTGPFQLLIIPAFGTPRNFSIPDSAFSGGKGTFSTPVVFPEKQRIVLAMSDATGFGTGGVSDVLLVQPSLGKSCNTTDPGVSFLFRLDSALSQCRPFDFTAYPAASQPVTIRMLIPGGTPTVVQPPMGASSYSWVANVAAGTSMIFMMTDSKGGQGGASDIWVVGASDDSSCLNNNSPSSTLNPATITSSTPTPTAATSGQVSPTTSATASGVPISAIAGTVIGSLFFLAVIVTLGLFFLKNIKNRSNPKNTSPTGIRHSRRMQSDVTFFDRAPGPPNGAAPPYYAHAAGSAATLNDPFADTGHPDNQFAEQQQHDPFQASRLFYPPSPMLPPPQDPFNPAEAPNSPSAIAAPASEGGRSQGTSSTQQKASMAGVPYTPSRFVVHTDLEDELPPPDEDGVVELPPRYVERRRPTRAFSVRNPSPPRPNADVAAYPDPPPSNPSPFL